MGFLDRLKRVAKELKEESKKELKIIREERIPAARKNVQRIKKGLDRFEDWRRNLPEIRDDYFGFDPLMKPKKRPKTKPKVVTIKVDGTTIRISKRKKKKKRKPKSLWDLLD